MGLVKRPTFSRKMSVISRECIVLSGNNLGKQRDAASECDSDCDLSLSDGEDGAAAARVGSRFHESVGRTNSSQHQQKRNQTRKSAVACCDSISGEKNLKVNWRKKWRSAYFKVKMALRAIDRLIPPEHLTQREHERAMLAHSKKPGLPTHPRLSQHQERTLFSGGEEEAPEVRCARAGTGDPLVLIER